MLEIARHIIKRAYEGRDRLGRKTELTDSVHEQFGFSREVVVDDVVQVGYVDTAGCNVRDHENVHLQATTGVVAWGRTVRVKAMVLVK